MLLFFLPLPGLLSFFPVFLLSYLMFSQDLSLFPLIRPPIQFRPLYRLRERERVLALQAVEGPQDPDATEGYADYYFCVFFLMEPSGAGRGRWGVGSESRVRWWGSARCTGTCCFPGSTSRGQNEPASGCQPVHSRVSFPPS